ncbi:MAG: hypothetical protein M1381_01080 [Deltaproteobacteria bacterium]|nr:hypothetical protein [Deltaproteobacteria bacterium]MCL5792163.1 hypothetical protein [Deltaproteobacteria bacterium]
MSECLNMLPVLLYGEMHSIHALWTFPLIVILAFIIAWAAESAQFFLSQGLALALLAWFQTAPEFMVEADLAWKQQVHLLLANFTGSLRLLTGVGLPLVFFVSYLYNRKHKNGSTIIINETHSIEVVFFLLGTIYLFFIYLKGSLNMYDGLFMISVYAIYLMLLFRLPSSDKEEHIEYVPRKVISMKPFQRTVTIVMLFLAGGLGLILVVGPFIGSMMGIAATLGVSNFIFIQWVAPFLSEFPEKLSAFYWAKKKTGAAMGLMNLTSSTINQLTILPALLPFIYAVSIGHISPIHFDTYQKMEMLLTFAQCITVALLLIDMRFTLYEASLVFVMWLIQFIFPDLRGIVMGIFLGWALLESVMIVAGFKGMDALNDFVLVYKKYIKIKKEEV